jgi:RsiW-degrading membrane proteinase PrsW (M82 family)
MRISRLFRTGLLNIIFLLGFLLLAFLLGGRVLLTGGGGLKFIWMVLLVFVPSLVSVLFYFLQDRHEPEPAGYIAYAFLSGMAAAALALIPLWRYVFKVEEWIHASTSLFLLGSLLVLAPAVSLLLYGILRYGFLPLREFDEPVDGMVYGAVAGVGLAFVVSLNHLLSRPDCTVFVIAYVSTSHILVYSAVGALIGYFLGRSKFCGNRIDVYALFAVLLGTLLLAVYHLLNEFIFLSGWEHAFWISFFLTLAYALLVLLFGVIRMHRLVSQGSQAAAITCPKLDTWTSFMAVLLLLAGFLVSAQGMKGRTFASPEHGFSFTYPHSLSQLPFRNPVGQARILAANMKTLFAREGGSELPVYVSVRVYVGPTREETPELIQFVSALETESLTVEDSSIGGEKATRIVYSYLRETESPRRRFPRLIQVQADLVQRDGRILVFIYGAEAGVFERGEAVYERLLQTVRWGTPKGE